MTSIKPDYLTFKGQLDTELAEKLTWGVMLNTKDCL